jgi:DNA-binding transcriptional MerR regulator
MRIGELGDLAGLSAKTIRYYEDIRILPEPERTSSGYRDYDDVALERLRFIKSAQAVGFSLGEIREVLAFGDRGEAPCLHVTQLMEDRIRSLSEHIRGLQQMRSELERLVKNAKTLAGPNSGTFCHIIDLAKPLGSRSGGVGSDRLISAESRLGPEG